jgi:hypothetical protein
MEETPKQNPRKKSPPIDLGKYAGMGFQMAAIIGLGTFAGIKLDQFLGLKKVPVFTLLLALLSVFGAMYFFIKDFLKKK